MLSSYIDRFPEVRALVVGDMMLDIFMYGTVRRISPEAPVPVFQFTGQKEMLGGAGNVAANLASLGCRTSCVGIIGEDKEGEKVARLLKESGCESALLRVKNHLTTVKTRLIASHNHLLRADRETPRTDLSPIEALLLENVERLAAEADIVLFSDYDKGLLTPEITPQLIERCVRSGKPVIVDPKGNHYSKYDGATLVKPNLKEFQEATGMTLDPLSSDFHAEASRGARLLFEQCHLKNLIVTLSEHGMMHLSSEEPSKVFQLPTEAREVFDVSGAGDTSFAALGAALGCGASFEEALRLANLASGIVVAKLGTSCVSARELKELLIQKQEKSIPSGRKANIIPREKITSVLTPLRERGKKIGFTNGCFDLMHLGHLESFMRARAECDVLVVGVNSDASVRSYKGPNRPIQDEQTRAALVASLEYVDYVVLFDETTAEPLADLVHPDVIAKEGYSIDKWPEARKVIAYGGRAVTLPRTEGYSTSDLIAKIKGGTSEPPVKG